MNDCPVKSDVALREESLRPDSDKTGVYKQTPLIRGLIIQIIKNYFLLTNAAFSCNPG
jgi:hypothetical protein